MNSKAKSIEETYQKKSQLEHVLHRPGMYIGDIDPITAERWILIDSKMSKKLILCNLFLQMTLIRKI
jgi:DNA topoisomerase-2